MKTIFIFISICKYSEIVFYFPNFFENIFKKIFLVISKHLYNFVFQNQFNMASFAEIETQIQKAVEKRRKLILDALDGRTQRSISEKTGIDETRLSKWINGLGSLEQTELDAFNNILGTDFTLNA